MENKKDKKCSLKNHKDLDAIKYCQECKINMCTKCSNFHSEIFANHNLDILIAETNELFRGFCFEENHNLELEFFCITHNKLCCAACLCKIKNKGKGQHNKCNVCNIEEIKERKKNELVKNINILEDYSKMIEKTINEFKEINEEIDKNKESLQQKVQNIFTKIRCALNEREDKILLEIEKQYNELYFKEEMIKNCEKLPKKFNLYLERGKIVNNEWDNDNKLNYIIFNCVKIENNIKEYKKLTDCIENYNTTNRKICFFPEDEEFEKILKSIESFGEIKSINDLPLLDVMAESFQFENCEPPLITKDKNIVHNKEIKEIERINNKKKKKKKLKMI